MEENKFVFENLRNMCRLCFSKTSLVSIFDKRLESTENMAEVVEVTTGVKISPEDEISHMLCNKCSHLTIRMFKFRTTSMLNDIDLREKAAMQKTIHKSMQELFRIYPHLKVPSSVIKRDVSPYVTLENNIKNYLNKSKSKLLKMKISRNLPLQPSNEGKVGKLDSVVEPKPVASCSGLVANRTEIFQNREHNPPSFAAKRTTNSCEEYPLKKKSKRENGEEQRYEDIGNALFTVKPNYKTLQICDLCNQIFYNMRELKKHKLLHMRCKLCRRSFSSMEKTKDHEENCTLKKIMSNMPKVEIERCDQIREIREKYPTAFQDSAIIEISDDDQDSTHDSISPNKQKANTTQSDKDISEESNNVRKYYKSLKVFVRNSTHGVETPAKSVSPKNANESMESPDKNKILKSYLSDSKKLNADECKINKDSSTSGQQQEKKSTTNYSGTTSLDQSKEIAYSIVPPEKVTSNFCENLKTYYESSKKLLGDSSGMGENEEEKDRENEAANGQKTRDIEKFKEAQTEPEKIVVVPESTENLSSERIKIVSDIQLEVSNLKKSKEKPLFENSKAKSDNGKISEVQTVDAEKTQKCVNSNETHNSETENINRERKSIENSKETKKIKSAPVADEGNTLVVHSSPETNSKTNNNLGQTSEKKTFIPKIIITDKDSITVDSADEDDVFLENLLQQMRKDENRVGRTMQTDLPSNNDILKKTGDNFLYELKNLRNYLSFSNIPVTITHSKVASIKYSFDVSSLMRNQIKLQTKLKNVNIPNIKKRQNIVSSKKAESVDMQNKLGKVSGEMQETSASTKCAQEIKEKKVDELTSFAQSEHKQTEKCGIEKQIIEIPGARVPKEIGKDKVSSGNTTNSDPKITGELDKEKHKTEAPRSGDKKEDENVNLLVEDSAKSQNAQVGAKVLNKTLADGSVEKQQIETCKERQNTQTSVKVMVKQNSDLVRKLQAEKRLKELKKAVKAKQKAQFLARGNVKKHSIKAQKTSVGKSGEVVKNTTNEASRSSPIDKNVNKEVDQTKNPESVSSAAPSSNLNQTSYVLSKPVNILNPTISSCGNSNTSATLVTNNELFYNGVIVPRVLNGSSTIIPNTTPILGYAMSNMPLTSVNTQPQGGGPFYIVTEPNNSMTLFQTDQLHSNAATFTPTQMSCSNFAPATQLAVTTTVVPTVSQLGPNVVQTQTIAPQVQPPRPSLPATSTGPRKDCLQQVGTSKQVTTSKNKPFPCQNYTPATQHAVSTSRPPDIRQLGPNVVQTQTVTSQIQPSLPTTSTAVSSGSRKDSLQQASTSSWKQTPPKIIRIVPRESVYNSCVANASKKIPNTKDANSGGTVGLNENCDRFSGNKTATAASETPKYIRVRNLAELK